MKITVTQEDINLGTPVSSCNCPVARAIQRACPTNEVSVYNARAWVDGLAFPFIDPAIPKFILAFDNGFHVNPFSFNLPL